MGAIGCHPSQVIGLFKTQQCMALGTCQSWAETQLQRVALPRGVIRGTRTWHQGPFIITTQGFGCGLEQEEEGQGG